MSRTILLAGATGMLGGRIAHHLSTATDAHLRLLVRNSDTSERRQKLKPFVDKGAEVIVGDLADAASLDRATQGVDVIVSAVQGGREVIVDGQVALATAGKRNGVTRILPSDFGLDLFKASPGEHPSFNWRQEADRQIGEIGLEQVNVLQGAFMNMFGPGSPFVDFERGTMSFWGDGDQPIEMTTIDDTARVTALVARDESVPAGKFEFWGDRKTFNEAADLAETVFDKRFRRISLGDETRLRATIAAADPQTAMMLAYSIYMLNGQTALERQDIGRYPDVQLTDLNSMLRKLATSRS